jgi:hypothetical protein
MTILRKEGVTAFWKGNAVMIGGWILPIEVINFYTRKSLQPYFTNTLMNNIFISIISGMTAATILYPTDVLRQFLNNNTQAHLSVINALKKIVSLYGFKYFYKGYPTILVTTIVYRGCYNGSYDTHKRYAKNWKDRVAIAYFSSLVAEYIVYPI